jgi:hypothetical protein
MVTQVNELDDLRHQNDVQGPNVDSVERESVEIEHG